MEGMSETRARVASLLRYYREAAGLTTAEVGRRVGKSDRTVSAWENGRGQPDADIFLELCGIYGVESVNVFFGQNIPGLTPVENHLLGSFRELNTAGQRAVVSVVDGLVAIGTYQKAAVDAEADPYLIAARGGDAVLKVQEQTQREAIDELFAAAEREASRDE